MKKDLPESQKPEDTKMEEGIEIDVTQTKPLNPALNDSFVKVLENVVTIDKAKLHHITSRVTTVEQMLQDKHHFLIQDDDYYKKKRRIVKTRRWCKQFFCGDGRFGFFDRFMPVWVISCMVIGVAFGKLVPAAAFWLNAQAIYIKGAPVISIPIAIALFFMMFPIMIKIEFGKVLQALRHIKPLLLTLFMNWIIAPFSTYGFAMLFLGLAFRGPIDDKVCDAIRVGYDYNVGSSIGYGTVGCYTNGTLGTDICIWDKFQFNSTFCDTNSTQPTNYLVLPMWRSYVGGAILLGNGPCTAMVLVWSYLVKGNEAHALAMVAINSLLMLPFYGLLCMLLLGLSVFPLPWESMLLSLGIYVAFPLGMGVITRLILVRILGRSRFDKYVLGLLSPLTIIALLFTLIMIFSLNAEILWSNPLVVLMIFVPLTLQFFFSFFVGYFLAWVLRIPFEDAAPTAIIGSSNNFEVAIATASVLYGMSSGAALAATVGVIMEVPLMLFIVKFCGWTKSFFKNFKYPRD